MVMLALRSATLLATRVVAPVLTVAVVTGVVLEVILVHKMRRSIGRLDEPKR